MTAFTRYAVRFDYCADINVVAPDEDEQLAIKKAQEIMIRSKRILNPDILATARIVYAESAD